MVRNLVLQPICFAALLLAGVLLVPASQAHAAEPKKVLFIAGGPSHGFGAHDHLSGCHVLANKLKEAMPGYETSVSQGWPKDAAMLDGVNAIVIYCDGGPGHLAIKHIAEIEKLTKKGVGVGCIHYAVEVPEDEGGEYWLKWMGGYFQANKSVNPHWTANFTKFPDHPVARGVKPFSTYDEWYYNMQFRDGMKNVTPILTAIPPDSTRQGKDDPHGGNPEVRSAIGKNQPEHVMWVSDNENGSRGFGTSGGHVHWNWAQDDWRKAVLNATVWIAKGEVPANGVESKRPTMDELMSNADEKIPDKFDKAAIEKQILQMNESQPLPPPDAK
jgi:hypothetical protein